MAAFLVALGFMGIFFILMSVRLIFLKDGKFKGTCASQSPFLNNAGEPCGFCGKLPENCENKDSEVAENEVDKVLGKFS